MDCLDCAICCSSSLFESVRKVLIFGLCEGSKLVPLQCGGTPVQPKLEMCDRLREKIMPKNNKSGISREGGC